MCLVDWPKAAFHQAYVTVRLTIYVSGNCLEGFRPNTRTTKRPIRFPPLLRLPGVSWRLAANMLWYGDGVSHLHPWEDSNP